jgi:hypothetical protein
MRCYSITSTCTRFPSSALSTALLSEVQQIVPLLHIRVRESAVTDVEPAGLPLNDFSSPLGPQNRGLRQKPCTTRSGQIRDLVISGLTPFSFDPRFAHAATPHA